MLEFSSGQLALLSALTGIWGASLTVIGGWGTLRKPEVHHFYWGLLALFIANALETFGVPAHFVDVVGLVGVSLIVDDTVQHAIQAIQFARTGKITFLSPWHDLYVWLYRQVERRRWRCPLCESAARAVVVYDLGDRVVSRRAKWCHTCLGTP